MGRGVRGSLAITRSDRGRQTKRCRFLRLGASLVLSDRLCRHLGVPSGDLELMALDGGALCCFRVAYAFRVGFNFFAEL